MTSSRINVLLGILLVVIAATLLAATGGDRANPDLEFLPDMKRSPAHSAYEPNQQLHDSRTLQTPVPETIARGEMPLRFKPTPEEAVRAGDELIKPFEEGDNVNQASVGRGGNLSRVYCTPCHGSGGQGDGLVVRKGYPAPTESLVTGKSTKMEDGQLFHIVTYGKYPDGVTEPPRFPRMPSFAPQLTPSQRWDVINYIRSLQAAKLVDKQMPTAANGELPDTTSQKEEQPSSTDKRIPEERSTNSNTPQTHQETK